MVLLSAKSAAKPAVVLGNLSMNLQNYAVIVGQEDVELSYQEFELLLLLTLQPDRILPHEEITLSLWNAAGKLYLRRLAVLVHRVRAKLARSQPYVVKGVRGRGYGLIAVRPPSEKGAKVPEG